MKTNEWMALFILCVVLVGVLVMAMARPSADALGSAPPSPSPAASAPGPAAAAAPIPAGASPPRPSAAAPAPVPPPSGVFTASIRVVNGYYEPRVLRVRTGQTVRLDLDPATFQGCMTVFNIWGLGVRKAVTASDHLVEFVADKPGTYRTSCNMGMGDGTLIVE